MLNQEKDDVRIDTKGVERGVDARLTRGKAEEVVSCWENEEKTLSAIESKSNVDDAFSSLSRRK